MSKITDLISPKKEVIFRGEKFTLNAGFTIEETPSVSKAFGTHDIDIKYQGIKEILKILAKRLYPEATDKQISAVDVKYSGDLLEVFYQLDETSKDEQTKIKETLENVNKK